MSRRPLQIGRDARILIRTPNWIGDVVIGTAAIAVLRKYFPDARISALAKPWVIPVLQYNPHLDEIIQYDAAGVHKGAKGILRLSGFLRRQRFEAAILFQRAFEAALLASLARIPVRMGYATDGRGFLLTHKARAAREEFLIPRLEHDLKLLEGFGFQADRKEPFLGIGAEQKSRALKILREIGIESGDRFHILSPGSVGGLHKRWAPDRFAALAVRIGETWKSRGILLGASHEWELGEEVRRLASIPDLVNLAGRTSLGEAMALTAASGLFVTNDSGLMHVAAALGVPLAAIFGPTDPRKTAPWSQRAVLVRNEETDCAGCKAEECRKGHVCMTGITVDQVFLAIRHLVERHGFEPAEARLAQVPTASRSVPIIAATRQEEIVATDVRAGGRRRGTETRRSEDG